MSSDLSTTNLVAVESRAEPAESVDPHRFARGADSTKLPPVVILGGGANALSVARSFGRRKIKVYAINKPDAAVCYSRFAERIPIPHCPSYVASWTDFLTGPQSEHLRGAVLLAASDVGLEIIANHRQALKKKYRLDESNPLAQLAMLDKLSTYQAATAAGVSTPRYWSVASREQLHSLRDSLVYPLLVKPKSSYAFTDRFRGKFFVANDFREVILGCERIADAGIECLLVEKIPGPDSLLCSYYTYLDEDGQPLFDFTKRIIRRNPPGMGLASYHITDWNPAVRDAALPLFQAVGLRGLANAEFKLDERDGMLKLIECNARFTEANGLVAQCGFDLAKFVYNRILGIPQEPLDEYHRGLRLWYPLDDLRAFLTLRRQRQLNTSQWLASVFHRQCFPLFRWSDPLPSLGAAWLRVKSSITSRKPEH